MPGLSKEAPVVTPTRLARRSGSAARSSAPPRRPDGASVVACPPACNPGLIDQEEAVGGPGRLPKDSFPGSPQCRERRPKRHIAGQRAAPPGVRPLRDGGSRINKRPFEHADGSQACVGPAPCCSTCCRTATRPSRHLRRISSACVTDALGPNLNVWKHQLG